jgi:hypothetical protein
MFELNRPIAILTGYFNAQVQPLALYAIVRSINAWTDGEPQQVKYTVTVEVHISPSFVIDWCKTRPWPGIPLGAVFIHPHTFQAPNYRPLSLEGMPTSQMVLVRYDVALLYSVVMSEEPMYHVPASHTNLPTPL